MDVTFFESMHFFSPSKTSLQGKSLSEERLLCLPSFLALPSPIHPSSCDSTSDNKKDLVVYTRRQKDFASALPLVVSLDLGNTHFPFETDSLPIALCNWKRSSTDHSISNFVSYKSLNPSYTTFVNSISFVSIPSNLKEVISHSQWS